jgi:hypothetical protein
MLAAAGGPCMSARAIFRCGFDIGSHVQVAEVLVETLLQEKASRVTFEVAWEKGRRRELGKLLSQLRPDATTA